jgi:hypothetical protein
LSGNYVDTTAATWFTGFVPETTTTHPTEEVTVSQFSTTAHGLLPAGTETPQGVIVGRSYTAYEMADGTYVPFVTVHGPYTPAEPLVVLR